MGFPPPESASHLWQQNGKFWFWWCAQCERWFGHKSRCECVEQGGKNGKGKDKKGADRRRASPGRAMQQMAQSRAAAAEPGIAGAHNPSATTARIPKWARRPSDVRAEGDAIGSRTSLSTSSAVSMHIPLFEESDGAPSPMEVEVPNTMPSPTTTRTGKPIADEQGPQW